MRKSLPDEDLLNRLEDIFLKCGYRKITLADLVSELKCSRRRLYHFAESKEALFLVVMKRFFERLQREGRRRADLEPDHGDKIRALLSAGLEAARRGAPDCGTDLLSSPEGIALLNQHKTVRIKDLAGILEGGTKAGVFRPVCPQLMAEIFVFAIMKAREPEFQAEAGVSFAKALEDLSLVMREGLRTDGPLDAVREKTFSRTLDLMVQSIADTPAG